MKITIDIPDQIYAKLKQAVIIRNISGNSYGIIDDFMFHLIDNLEKGKEVWEVKQKK